METRSFRPESHVAQQSRRDKLRGQQSLTSVQYLDDYPNSLERISVNPGLSPDLVHVRNNRNDNTIYDSTMFSSEILKFATSSHVLSAPKVSIVDQELGAVPLNKPIIAEDSSFTGMTSHPVLSNFNASHKASSCDPQGCGNWRSLDSQQSYDLMVNYAGGSVGGERNQKPMFVGEVLSNNARVSNISTSRQYLMPGYNGNQNVQLPSTLRNTFGEISSEDSIKQLRVMQVPSLPPYQNAAQDVIPSGCFRPRMNERILHPSFVTESTASHFDNNGSTWMSRPLENYHHWSTGELGLVERTSDQEMMTITSDANTQGLSLSLSSINPPSKVEVTHFGEEYASEHLQLKVADRVSQESHQDSKFSKSSSLCALAKPSIITKSCGKSIHDIVGTSTHALRNTGPLGPFTGYATILKSSKFLKPAQQLLEEFSSRTGPRLTRTFEMSEDQVTAPALADIVNEANENSGTNAKNYSGIPSSSFYCSNKASGGDDEGGSGGSCGSYGPEYQQKKAKLLFLQEEVCRRYKQYHQQMQMVASSFESVASLSAATPYVSLALKTVSSNFRSLKHGISDQLKLVTKALGDNLFSRNTVAVGSKGDTSTSRSIYMDQSIQKNKSGGVSVGYHEPQQHIWRPQRGLPERSVAILRAWLFEHFLHPYPTDTDKHMLATRTGLSRNQISAGVKLVH
ncbi:BEL1-like homeodomain protein 4 isoform X4 [Populus nigra]|uniref:BEL1-like homeodomain protein 4 isoform X4 n=1 Tax=Populus nigra TaxID=3691 RepID=UPI002B27B4C1|nr:BEL1-like homeodomain protein 4 isoform X4 [Populus nigra]